MQLIWFPKSEVFSIKSNLQQTFKLSLDLSFTKMAQTQPRFPIMPERKVELNLNLDQNEKHY